MENYTFELIGPNIVFKVNIENKKALEMTKRILEFIREDLGLLDEDQKDD